MNEAMETQILAAEEQLRIAMLNSDLRALDELLAPEMIFTNHLGQLLGKKDDLGAYQSGLLQVKELTPSERQIQKKRLSCQCGCACRVRTMAAQPMAISVSRASGLPHLPEILGIS